MLKDDPKRAWTSANSDVNNKIYGVEYGLFGRYGMKEDLSLREYMDAM